MQILLENYIWLKWLHYLAFISWMAGLFYLPRLFVYHSENLENKGFVEVVKVQERKLFYYIQNPAMIVTVLTGLLMLLANSALLSTGGYMHAKLSFAFLLLVFHFSTLSFVKAFQNDTCKRGSKFFRIYNEIPTLLLIAIITMMILKPF
ncbi:hypothetical membrane protein (UPF0093 domain) [Campylobacter avium LMG 24591]|uniref:Protoporphyrinogen IX oxidase n=2 Tax=Campylobacter avium TaxID=522485 RepID=A0A222MZU5_9BACT|nr:protoporphyrinogen oxidase HemJ [Campylobacter avium]ASQ31102.1 hypothetical membrane protein (UPF0093 domain) [Campylobacter avium LMG 24591]OYD78485.1 hypothetical membrane protein (UPF0093 domain) [Campylobacter avium]HJE66556.1 protoporphyrinogen oxidase HemJ [Campylobacter avium]